MFEQEELEITITEEEIFCDDGKLEYSIDEDSGIVNSISVYRKRCGIGTKLVETFENLAKDFNVTVIEVPASPNKEAILFWKSLGYKPETDDDKYWARKITRSWKEGSWDTFSGIVLMEKNLKKSKRHTEKLKTH